MSTVKVDGGRITMTESVLLHPKESVAVTKKVSVMEGIISFVAPTTLLDHKNSTSALAGSVVATRITGSRKHVVTSPPASRLNASGIITVIHSSIEQPGSEAD